MTALEWTTLSKLTEHSLLSFYGAGGQPALTGFKLWKVGTYKCNIVYILTGISLLTLFGVSLIAPLGVHTCTIMYDTTSIETIVVKPDLLSFIINDTFSSKKLAQVRVMLVSEFVNELYLEDFNKTYIINKTDVYPYPSQLHPLGNRNQNIDLLSRSIRYSQLMQFIVMQHMNMTSNGTFIKSKGFGASPISEPKSISSTNELLNGINNTDIYQTQCEGFGHIDTIADKTVGIKSSVEVINMQTNTMSKINVLDKQTIPMKWYIENANLNINDMYPWWGGAGNTFYWGFTTDAQTAGIAGLAINIMLNNLVNDDLLDLTDYRADGIGNLALLQQWKEKGTTEEGIS
ncbi:1574_t:CDS:2, partial [Racocetra fulgida]